MGKMECEEWVMAGDERVSLKWIKRPSDSNCPDLTQLIFGFISTDLKSLLACREVSRSFRDYVDSHLWKRFSLLDTIVDGRPDIFRRMMKNSPEKNPVVSYRRNNTALHAAAWYGNLEISRWILDQVKDKNPRNYIGQTPLLEAAAGAGLAATVNCTRQATVIMTKEQPPRRCEKPKGTNGQWNQVFKLIFDQLDESEKNPTDMLGNTPLHMAAEHGNIFICQLITSHLVNKAGSKCRGHTPLDFARARKKSLLQGRELTPRLRNERERNREIKQLENVIAFLQYFCRKNHHN